MAEIMVSRPDEGELQRMEVERWPIWEKGVSRFDWSYSEEETCYILSGRAKVETDTGIVEFGKGDLVSFPAGLECVWDIQEPIRKHYRLG